MKNLLMLSLFPQTSRIRSQKGLVLVAALVVMIFLAIIFGGMSLQTVMGLKGADKRIDLHQAFYAAETGVDWTIFQLRSKDLWLPNETVENPVTLDGTANGEVIGYFTSQLLDLEGNELTARSTIGRETLRIRSTGWDVQHQVYRTIEADIAVENPARYLVSTLGDLYMRSGAHITADVLCQNFNFDVDTNLPDGDPNKIIDVDGNIYYMQNVNGEKDPSVVVDSSNEIKQKPSVSFASIDIVRYRTTAQTMALTKKGLYITSSNTPYTINLDDYGTGKPSSPQIIFADGDVTVHGTYAYSMTVVANGNIKIDGNVKPVEGQKARPQIGLLAKKDVIIPATVTGDLTVEGFLIADGGVANDSSYGTFQALGSKGSKGRLTFSGSIAVRGEAGSGLRTAIDLDAFSSREYNHFPSLVNGYNIPFSPFMVNLLKWQEINPIRAVLTQSKKK